MAVSRPLSHPIRRRTSMAKVFITGSADGLGFLAGRHLLEVGHEVVLHARSPARAEETRRRLPALGPVVVGDLASLAETRRLADAVNRLGRFEADITKDGVGYQEDTTLKEDMRRRVFAV